MKQSCESCDACKWSVTANKTIGEKDCYSYIVINNACAQVWSHISHIKSHINTHYLIAIHPGSLSVTCFQNKCTHRWHAVAMIFTTVAAGVVMLEKGAASINKIWKFFVVTSKMTTRRDVYGSRCQSGSQREVYCGKLWCCELSSVLKRVTLS